MFSSNPGRLLASVLLFLVCLVVFSLLAHEVVIENEDWFDNMTFNLLKIHLTPFAVIILNFITFFGSAEFLFAAYIFLILLLSFKGKKMLAFDTAVVGITSTLLLYLLKAVFARNRPEFQLSKELKDYSFPSGHTFSTFIFFAVLSWLIWKTGIGNIWKFFITLFFILITLLIGISRIMLRYHYASDVVAGLSLGIAYMMVFSWLQKKPFNNAS